MTIGTWTSIGSQDYNTSTNRDTLAVPNEFVDAAVFGKDTITSISIYSSINVGEWIFDPQAMQYNFIVAPVIPRALWNPFRLGGPVWTPIIPSTGSFFHAYSQLIMVRSCRWRISRLSSRAYHQRCSYLHYGVC
jgi:hypothetical protein